MLFHKTWLRHEQNITVANQPEKVCAHSKQNGTIHRLQDIDRRLRRLSGLENPSGENLQIAEADSQSVNTAAVHSSNVSPNSRAMHQHVKGSTTSQAIIEKSVQASPYKNSLGQYFESGCINNTGSNLVVHRTAELERSCNYPSSGHVSSRDRCKHDRLGCLHEQQNGCRVLGHSSISTTLKLPRTNGSLNGRIIFQGRSSGKEGTNSNGQYHNGCIYLPSWGAQQGSSSLSSNTVDNVHGAQHRIDSALPCGKGEYNGGLSVSSEQSPRMEITPSGVQNDRHEMGQTHNRQIRKYVQQSDNLIQFPILGSRQRGCRCSCSSRLGDSQQLCECTVQHVDRSIECDSATAGGGNSYCSEMARTSVVPEAQNNEHRAPVENSTKKRSSVVWGSETRTIEKQSMETVRLEDSWQQYLNKKGWSSRASKQFQEAWAPSTRRLYNGLLKKCACFCFENDIEFPPRYTKDLAEFLCVLADASQAPRSQLNSAGAALTALYTAMELPNLMHKQDIQLLVTALVKSGTERPMQKSTVMPIAPFRALFLDGVTMKISH